LVKLLRSTIKRIINSFGYDLTKIHFNKQNTRFIQTLSASTEDGISRCKKKDIEISTVIDVGASDGRWTKMCMKYYSKSSYFLIEAQQPHEENLIKFKKKYKNVDYIISAAGNRQGQIYFDVSNILFGRAQEEAFEKDCIKVPVTTIDHEVRVRSLKPPFLIKLDTHGYEVPILEGARETLGKSNILILETYFFKLSKNCLKFYDICKYLENKGFYPIDMVEIIHRPYDYSLWQVDMYFTRSDGNEFIHNF